ncbi:MAG: exodeoxyribonuclease VII large subunit [Bacteroidetes bacterium]|jgi:exodeoxyribonuclease VII large subunit|nr:exodeoxyribonuclease VII large subunit [Bacteroidota bacterium]
MATPSLFDDASAPDVYTVSQLTGALREAVEDGFEDVTVEGELSDFRTYRSGHCYFTVKDEDAQLRGVMWKGYTKYLFFDPEDGMLVRIHGYISLYERRGDVQIIARSMKMAGEGALQKAFEELKRTLEAEGLFDAAHKQRIPSFPETLGIITSTDGAALHDMLSVLRRRFPQVQVYVCGVRVQGMGAAGEIAEALQAFNALPEDDPMRPDALLVGRGGGSTEDLWAFNEEAVARAIYDSAIPVISAVGHETDVSIADLVADARAATPSMAAEVAVPDRRDVEAVVRSYHQALHDDLTQRVAEGRQRVHSLTRSRAFHRPVDRVRELGQRLDDVTARLHRAGAQRLERERHRLESLRHRLDLLDPMRPLERGYVRVEREGQPVRQAADLDADDLVALRFADGERTARIEP